MSDTSDQLHVLKLNQNQILARLSRLEDILNDRPRPFEQKNDTTQWYIDQFSRVNKKNAELMDALELAREQCARYREKIAELEQRCDNSYTPARYVAFECLAIVRKIKNEPITGIGPTAKAMIAVCEDIEAEIKKEFKL